MTQQHVLAPLAFAVPASDPPPSPRRSKYAPLADDLRAAGYLLVRLSALGEQLRQCSAGGGDEGSPSASR